MAGREEVQLSIVCHKQSISPRTCGLGPYSTRMPCQGRGEEGCMKHGREEGACEGDGMGPHSARMHTKAAGKKIA